jgi:lipoteichoic acid synthase
VGMKKYKVYLINYGFFVYLEFIFALLTNDEYLRSSIFNVLIYLIPVSALFTLLTTIFKDKVNKILMYIGYTILGLWFSLEFVFKAVFKTSFSLSLFKLSDQVIGFGNETMLAILKNSYGILLLFVPLILIIIFRKKLKISNNKFKDYLLIVGILIFGMASFYLNLQLQKGITYGAYQLFYDINENTLNIEKLGVLDATMLDTYRTIFGFDEKIIESKEVTKDKDENDDIFEYDYNKTNIDFSKLTSNNSSINIINSYMNNDTGTQKNKYTGIFKGKNLIYITAESFNEIGVSETLTPTLYKLVNNGFKFDNFYTSYSLSTIGGEFQSLTGLYATYSTLRTFRNGTNYFPYGLGTVYKGLGYSTYAYHDHYYNFQDRNVYLKSMDFDNYKACYNGLENVMQCGNWPNSDIDMINATVGDYINSTTPFMAYYMTVSGHMNYTRSGNNIVNKNWSLVSSLPYSDEVKGYIATQIELDKALETLINKLDEAGKLDNTVIVLLADHYPYDLSINQINEAATYTKDGTVEVNHSNLIIWNNKLKNIDINKVCMSIDVLPTVYNLFGVDYDSRLFIGKDILSTEPGLALFDDRSWVTNTGTYFSYDGSHIAKTDAMTSDYIKNMNSIVSNKINISRKIMETDYYRYIFNK